MLHYHLILGVSKPRESNHMPNGYEVVNALKALKQQAQKHKYVTSLVGVWGEMLLHDLAATLHPSKIIVHIIVIAENVRTTCTVCGFFF